MAEYQARARKRTSTFNEPMFQQPPPDKGPSDFDASRTVKVGNVSGRATARLLNIFFEPCGRLTSVFVNAANGWALVEFETVTASQTALSFYGCVKILTLADEILLGHLRRLGCSSEFLQRRVTVEPYQAVYNSRGGRTGGLPKLMLDRTAAQFAVLLLAGLVFVVVYRDYMGTVRRNPLMPKDPDCLGTDSSYVLKHDRQCSSAVIQYWQANALALGPKADCSTDPDTLKISCTAFGQCAGGETRTFATEISLQDITYTCADSCQGMLLVQCCEECKKNEQLARDGLKPFNQIRSAVHCPGCDAAQLETIKQSSSRCRMVDGARFECQYEQTCQVGEPSFTKRKQEQSCSVTPCDACSDEDLKAHCCLACAESACQGSKPDLARRKICRGCMIDVDNPAEHLSTAQLKERLTMLGIDHRDCSHRWELIERYRQSE